jgi:copper transport protein
VVATGLARTVDEVGGWSGLTGTGFGRALLVKLALFGGLLLLGAANHYRVVPGLRSGRVGLGRLRGTVGGELGLASAVLLSAALLSALPPGAGAAGRPAPGPAARARPARVQVAGADYTTSVRVTLTVSPGTAGPNRFTAEVVDYDSGRPAPAERVWLACTMPDRPDLGSLELDLTRAAEGRWTAEGSPLPVTGRWDVTAWVEAATGTVTVPLRVQVGRPGAGGELASGP